MGEGGEVLQRKGACSSAEILITFTTNIAQLQGKMREIFPLARDVDCRLWHRDGGYSKPYKLVTGDPSWTVQDAGIKDKEVSMQIIVACSQSAPSPK